MKKFWLTVIFMFALTGVADAQSLSLNATTFNPGATIQLAVRGAPTNVSHVSLYELHTASFVDWRWLDGTQTADPPPYITDADLFFTAPSTGDYIFKLWSTTGENLAQVTFAVVVPSSDIAYQFRATWRDNSNNEDGFYFYEWNQGVLLMIGITGPNVAQFDITGVAPANAEKCWTVSAFNALAESGLANIVCVRIGHPFAPINLVLQP